MAITYEPLASRTLTSTAITVSLTSISTSYTDLICVTNIKSSEVAYINFIVNDISTATYSQTHVYSQVGNIVGTGRYRGATQWEAASRALPSSTTAATYVITFGDYSNTNVFRSFNALSGSGEGSDMVAGLLRSTSAISKIEFYLSGGHFVTNSTFTLYGILRA